MVAERIRSKYLMKPVDFKDMKAKGENDESAIF